MEIKEDDDINDISSEIDKLLEKENILKYIDIGKEFSKKYSEYFNKRNLDIL